MKKLMRRKLLNFAETKKLFSLASDRVCMSIKSP
ncbi:hypothetical protein G5S_0544 [Chlamydia pecorum E58]|uniref:Uncharacterized protein n=1 Tax=Chlamydia pecorum (strain ATCC VR-628 / DSM 29919 / E58) TaxID=331635 RepID=A0AA34WI24_CHLPE|nr:hypothetical protein G5S_0544 [Chlamydia pecorum E58]